MIPARRGRLAEAVVLTAGIGVTVAQLVTARELMAQFSGNELVIAINLCVWLAMGALGAHLAFSGLPDASLKPTIRFAMTALTVAVVPVLELLWIRWLRQRLFLPGASAGFYPILGFILLTIAPYSFLTGWLLPRGLAVLRTVWPPTMAARVYVLDNIGNVVGGAVFSFLLVWWTTPMTALVLAGLPLMASAAALLKVCGMRLGLLAAATGGILVTMVAGVVLETESLGMRHGSLVHYEETRYGRLALYRDQGQVTLFRDGRPTVTTHDPATAEATVHYPLAIVDHARAVLLIGGSGAMMVELEKHRIESVDYVEIDPAAVRLQLDAGLMRPTPALNLIHQDGRAFLAGTGKRYDAIIVSLPDPDTFQLNRFFTEGFFQLAADHLRPDGVLGFSVQGYANYITPVQARKLSILHRTAGRIFRHVRALPGEQVHFLCRQEPVPLDIPERLDAKGIDTLYAGPYFYGEIDAMRVAELEAALDPGASLNTDFSPGLMRVMFDAWFAKFTTSPVPFALGVTALGLIYILRLGAAEYVLWTTGALVMGSEILVVFAFQIIYGHIYHQLGFIVTAFLAGMLPGALLAARYRGDVRRILMGTDLALILLLALLALALTLWAAHWPEAVFIVFGLALSLTAGFQFPVAVRWRGDDLRSASRAFSADLAGAAAGLLVVSLVLIPYLGLFWATGALILVKISSMAVIGRCRWTA